MVGIDIPTKHTLSPSSLGATPQLTINHDVGADLDSANAFEGPEKLLEIWFCPSPALLPAEAQPLGLKAVDEKAWESMLDLVHCKVLSVLRSDQVDAYLLSESSMFVYPHKLVLKTCGTTTLLWGIPRMLELAALVGFEHVTGDAAKGTSAAAATYQLFYSRKNFLNPDQQRGPHRSWRDEVQYLDHTFPGGSAYMIGKMNGEHWYLYLTAPDPQLTPPLTPESGNSSPATPEPRLHQPLGKLGISPGMSFAEYGETADETLEILMMDLDEDNAKQFYLDHASAVAKDQWMGEACQARSKHATYIEGHSLLDDTVATGYPGKKAAMSNGLGAPRTPELQEDDLFQLDSGKDHTLPEELSIEGHALGTVVSDSCGLTDIYPRDKYPGARIDAYLFTPCGFSANGIVPVPGFQTDNDRLNTHYFTVHVTPEPQCSYASFETNVPTGSSGRPSADVVDQVVKIFKPGRFTVTLFEAKPSSLIPAGESKAFKAKTKGSEMDRIAGYRRVDRIVHDLDGYDLVFRYYERFDWKGGAPRLGEVGH